MNWNELSWVYNFCLSCETIFESCTEHGSITAMLCAKFQNDFTTQRNGMHYRDIAFENNFRQIAYIAMALWIYCFPLVAVCTQVLFVEACRESPHPVQYGETENWTDEIKSNFFSSFMQFMFCILF